VATTKIGGDPQQNNNNIAKHLHEGTPMQRNNINNQTKPNQTKEQ